MNPLAKELNGTLEAGAPRIAEMLSALGRELYFPKGILTQTAEAKKKATRINATVGIAREGGEAMHLLSVMKSVGGLTPNEVLPYAPSTGVPELRAKWREEILRKNPSLSGKACSLPVVTSGVTNGLSVAGDLFVDPGDAVLLPEKVWGNYKMIFGVRRGAEILSYPFFAEGGGLDVDGLRRTLEENASRGKLVVVLNFPNNPTGYSLSTAEAEGVREALVTTAAAGCNVIVLCDDAYFGLFYDEACLTESPFAGLAGAHERLLALKLDGATKEDFVWGLRVGFLTFAASSAQGVHEALEKKAGGAIRGCISNCSHLSQRMVLRAMSDGSYDEEKRAKFDTLKARALKVREVLADPRFAEAFTPYPFNAGYFMCLKMKKVDAEEYRVRLLEERGIGVIAIGATDVRVAFSCVEEGDIPQLFDEMLACAQGMA
jgi:aspartate/methionine/tyrosine aminotransferase